MSAIQTFIRQTDWGKLDIMVIDMPPGTGKNDLVSTDSLSIQIQPAPAAICSASCRQQSKSATLSVGLAVCMFTVAYQGNDRRLSQMSGLCLGVCRRCTNQHWATFGTVWRSNRLHSTGLGAIAIASFEFEVKSTPTQLVGLVPSQVPKCSLWHITNCI